MNTHYTKLQDNTISITAGLGWVLLIFLGIVAIAFFTSCESKSGQLSKIPLEKVVIVDTWEIKADQDINRTEYKVKRINKSVVCWISLPGRVRYECGDTILYRFLPHQ